MTRLVRYKIRVPLIAILIIYICSGLFAQVNSTTPEKFLLHTDRSIYLTGETIWYKIYSTNYQEHTDHSKVVYVNLHGKNGGLLIQQIIQLEEGTANGSIPIPLSWNEDYYYITCFTRWNLQFERDQLESKKIMVYNPYEDNNNEGTALSSEVAHQENSNQGNVIIVLPKTTYGRREQCSMRITSTPRQRGTFSVAIHAVNKFEKNLFFMNGSAEDQSKWNVYYEKVLQHEKEQKLPIDGKATDPITGAPVKSDVFSMYKVGGDTFYRISSDDGNIHTSVDDFQGSSTFQLFNMNPYQPASPDFTLTRPGALLLGMDQEQASPPRNNTINDYLKNVRLNKKIHEIFEERTMDSLLNIQHVSFPFEGDKVYKMEKFKSMKTLEEFIREIVIYAELSKKDDKTTVRLKNTETQRFFMEKPWYLVDGYLTRDEEAVLNIPFKNLTRVELFITNKSILNQLETVMVRSGLIAVYTDNYYLKDQVEAQKNIFRFDGFGQSELFEGINPANPDEARENPDFESLIYWNPDVKLSDTAPLQFVTSDLLGAFVIEVKGVDEDGQPLFGSQVFSVGY